MRAVVVADIHANLAAFEAVLEDAHGRGRVDGLWCLGDIVGYGPQPRECIELLRSYKNITVAGNHDLAAVGLVPVDYFNSAAREAVIWSGNQLSSEDRDWLAGLPGRHSEGDFTLVHGSLPDPVWEYLVSPEVAAAHLAQQQTPACFVGHSHVPLVYRESPTGPDGAYLDDGAALRLDQGRFVANPGSTGQPRDGDPRAAYALVDTDTRGVSFHRIAYDIAGTQGLMAAAGLPHSLIARLAAGR